MKHLKLVSENQDIEIKQCVDCKFYRYNKPDPFPSLFHVFHMCTNPELLPKDPVRGSPSWVDCDYVRSGISYPFSNNSHDELRGKCGSKGIYFEKLPPSFLKRLFSSLLKGEER